jgi:hypothetical protein
MKIQIFWDTTPCRLVHTYGRFGDTAESKQFNTYLTTLDTGDLDSKFLRNVGEYLPNDTRHIPRGCPRDEFQHVDFLLCTILKVSFRAQEGTSCWSWYLWRKIPKRIITTCVSIFLHNYSVIMSFTVQARLIFYSFVSITLHRYALWLTNKRAIHVCTNITIAMLSLGLW